MRRDCSVSLNYVEHRVSARFSASGILHFAINHWQIQEFCFGGGALGEHEPISWESGWRCQWNRGRG
jgi:hypothetical protein